MENLYEYSQWVSDTTDGDGEVDYDYITDRKLLYGIHDVIIHWGKSRIKVKAKFDSGARSSSIGLSVAKKLGMGQELLDAYAELQEVVLDKDISKEEKKKMENQYTEEYSKKYPGISAINLVKSSSGFSLRPYVRLMLEFNGRFITTEVNLRDRSGMSVEMLVGLRDMK